MNKPLYTGEWVAFSPFDRIALAVIIHNAAKPGCRMAEVGSWLGNGSTQIFLEQLRGHPDSSVLCVDTWRGSANVQRHQEAVAKFDVFGTFRMNVENAHSPVKMHALVASSTEAAPLVADAAFDLVFIDADHSYAAVMEDVAAWRSKVKPGGILCGHDCEIRVTPEIRPRLLANKHADTIPGDGTRFPQIHPGCVLAVDEIFEGKASLCTDQPISLPNGAVGNSTIWFIRM